MGTRLASMTGYGSAAATVNGWRVRVECHSVNHRRLNLRIYTPDELRWLRPQISERIKNNICRGSIEVRFDLQPDTSQNRVEFDSIDEDRFAAVASELKRLAMDYRLVAPVSLEAVWEYRCFFDRCTDEVFSEDTADCIMPAFDEALDQLVASRCAEGQGLCRDLRRYCESLLALVDDVQSLREEDEMTHHSRVKARLQQALDEFDVGDIDEGRLAQEIAYYVEKGDISEEIQRTRSHLERLETLLDEPTEAIGKKIDFYLQELIREANTMGSKSQHAELTDRVIEMKSIIEKMREQAANVE